MDKKISVKEEKEANDLKSRFNEVHDQIFKIQEEINSLNEKSKDLLQDLNELRDEEIEFMLKLKNKYGEGSLNPFTMIYTKKENEKIS